jgi:hypothetical protein
LEHVPSLTQISNYVSRLKKQKGTSEKFTLESFNEAIDMKFGTTIPDDDHAPYVAGRNIEGEKFVIVWTSKHLLKLTRDRSHIQIDATYKLLYMGYPIFVSHYEKYRKKID